MNIKDVITEGSIYTTFVFDGVDSSSMGVVSVTNGSTYNTNILPSFTDSSITVDGYNGTYYFNSQMTEKVFNFNCFIQDYSFSEMDQLKAWLKVNKIAKLILPENPYRYYWVKLSAIGDLGNYPLTHSVNGGVAYTGNFSLEFKTISRPVSYGMFYYKDDIQYYEYQDIYSDRQEYLYDAGLLYQNEALPLSYALGNGNTTAYIYNPGTYESKPRITIAASEAISSGNLIITNEDTGTVSNITLTDLPADSLIIIDYTKNTVTVNGEENLSILNGDLLTLNPRDYIENIADATITNDGTNTKVILDINQRQVRTTDIGKVIMFKDQYGVGATTGVGGKISAINSNNNAFILTPESGLYSDPNVDVIITRADTLIHTATLPTGKTIDIAYAISPMYL